MGHILGDWGYLFVAVGALSGCIAASEESPDRDSNREDPLGAIDDSRSTANSELEVVNASSLPLTGIYTVPVNASSYGPNLLETVGGDLPQGEAFRAFLECGTYDVYVQDEKGESCQLEAVEVCEENRVSWTIDDGALEDCVVVPADS